MAANPGAFRATMARVPAGVAIVTALAEDGTPYGFTASSFCSVSLEPPLLLVCLARSANSYPVFAGCAQFAISVLRADQSGLALRFASKTADKFANGPFVRTAQGALVVDDAHAVAECTVYDRYDAGDHMILVGEVQHVLVAEKGHPAVYVDRGFRELTGEPV